jgi:two-component system LytT family response regulator
MNIRTLIVDDEPLARQSVQRFLKADPEIEVVGECADGKSAVAAIVERKPDLVFLDVQMPELDGFGVVSRVGTRQMPATIFVTAWDQYALAAFDANALDYLLKPFGKARFERALDRARTCLVKQGDGEIVQRVVQAIESAAARTEYVDRISIAENGRIVFVKAADVQWIEASGNYARLHTGARSYDIRETLTSLEDKLDRREFVRIHRSTIVNLQYVKEIHPWFHGYHLVLLESGRKLRMSRYQDAVFHRLGLRRPLA